MQILTQGQYVGSWVIGGSGPPVHQQQQQHQMSLDLSKVSVAAHCMVCFVRDSAAVRKQLQYDTTFSLAVICYKYYATHETLDVF